MTQVSPPKPTGGVLQVPVAATQKNSPKPAKKTPKPAAPRLKLLVRRLPPGLTQTEFENALGEEWQSGNGKVDWFQYKAGKVSKDPAKPSRPSRAYIHVVSADHVPPLSDKVRQTPFIDARHTANDAVLLGPPSLEFSPYAKIPGGRTRKDARQGTIDQDPDFIAFLESLTQPVTKPAVAESADGEEKKEGTTTTPLVQYIREKKAAKARESAAAKAAKQSKDKESKAEKAQAKKLLQRGDKEGSQAAAEKGEKKPKGDKASKEAVKAANKQAANVAKQATKSAANGPKDTPPSGPAADRKKERGNAGAAAKILQRDLGLGQSGGRRRGGKPSSGAESPKEEQAVDSGQKEPSPKPGRGKGKGSTTPQTSEALSRAPSDGGTPPAGTPTQGKPAKPAKVKQVPSVTPTATQAFLKHANPSQGVTEPLLEAAFVPFGNVVRVEIDRKKGFGYVDFAEPDGLQKAIAASPVTVAESQVVVLERRLNGAEKGRKGANSGKPGEGRGRGRGPRAGKGSERQGE